MYIADCVSVDICFVDHGRHHIRDALIHSSAQRPIEVRGKVGDSRLTLENVWFQRLKEPRIGRVNERGVLEGVRCTFDGLTFENKGTLHWKNSRIDNHPSEEGAVGADMKILKELQPIH